MSIDLRKCECWENILPMRADVHELWFANELSVDVDVSGPYLMCGATAADLIVLN